MKPSRKERKHAKQIIEQAALAGNSITDEVIKEKNGIITRLHMQLNMVTEEVDKKVSENISLTKELGQVKAQLREVKEKLEAAEKDNAKIRRSNDALAKEIDVIQDHNMALRQEGLSYEREIIDKDNKLLEKDKLLQEKDDLIQQLKRPWYRKLFG